MLVEDPAALTMIAPMAPATAMPDFSVALDFGRGRGRKCVGDKKIFSTIDLKKHLQSVWIAPIVERLEALQKIGHKDCRRVPAPIQVPQPEQPRLQHQANVLRHPAVSTTQKRGKHCFGPLASAAENKPRRV
ncbi:hypothetical protein DFJ73DRAFT_959799 [Zopfochytrium polystomum]|nr:hypothetical protein DFJ73DRAFT_959799 [Zopfochytrium polystomum]